MKYLKNEEEAKDCVQQIFLKVITELKKYRVDYFKSWLYMVAKNHCLMRSAAAPGQWIYVTSLREARESMRATDAGYVFSGHVHEQKLYYMGADGRPMPFRPVAGTPIPTPRHRQWLAIVGSAGQPRDRSNQACYALADRERSRLTFYRVPYDYGGAARKIRVAGLPEGAARRLERGT